MTVTPDEVQDDTRGGFPWWFVVALTFCLVAGYALFTSTPQLHPEVFLHQIVVLVDSDVPGDYERAKAKIARVREEALQPGRSFTVVAMQQGESMTARSDDPGEVGWIGRGIVAPQIEETAFHLELDEISKVIEDSRGFRILTISDRRGFAAE